jgi:hypothetical protein
MTDNADGDGIVDNITICEMSNKLHGRNLLGMALNGGIHVGRS